MALYELSDDPNPSIDVYPVFHCGSVDTKDVPEKLVEGKNGRGNLDYGIESRTTGRTIGLIEVKKDDFKQGFAQATVQMESSLSRKRKANEIDDEHDMDKDEGMKDMAEKVLGHILWF
ncbi:hypothetical protein RhiirA5_416363 [Rhizophagus irregularis]|uniref:Uncharacterized protein n=1 Tax=Rhizophagus irregularis TaxID=588596 RepID=A0A2N0PPZ9_9GLOM|nr:hypothetical protein RhiirA5_416363 [Rhizophagus irregularis]